MTLAVEQKLAIHELLSRAAYAYDERDMTALEESFAPGASMSLRVAGGDLVGPFEGRSAIMELMRGAMAQQKDVRRHVVSNIFFEDGGEHPVAMSNLTLVTTLDGKANILATGIYRDELVQDDGAWRILTRHVEMDSAY